MSLLLTKRALLARDPWDPKESVADLASRWSYMGYVRRSPRALGRRSRSAPVPPDRRREDAGARDETRSRRGQAPPRPVRRVFDALDWNAAGVLNEVAAEAKAVRVSSAPRAAGASASGPGSVDRRTPRPRLPPRSSRSAKHTASAGRHLRGDAVHRGVRRPNRKPQQRYCCELCGDRPPSRHHRARLR